MQWILVVVMLTADGQVRERIPMGSFAQCTELAGRMSEPVNQRAHCVQEYSM